MRKLIPDKSAEEIQQHFTQQQIDCGILTLDKTTDETDKRILLEEKLVEVVMDFTLAHRDQKETQPIIDVLCSLIYKPMISGNPEAYRGGWVIENSK